MFVSRRAECTCRWLAGTTSGGARAWTGNDDVSSGMDGNLPEMEICVFLSGCAESPFAVRQIRSIRKNPMLLEWGLHSGVSVKSFVSSIALDPNPNRKGFETSSRI